MKRLHTYKSFKINESVTDQDERWKWNFTNFDKEDIETYIETLLKSYKIPFRSKEVYEDEDEDGYEDRQLQTIYQFKYKDTFIRIQIIYAGPIIMFNIRHLNKHIDSFILDSLEHLNREILKIVQSDVNKALFKMNESRISDYLDDFTDEELLPNTEDSVYKYICDTLDKFGITYTDEIKPGIRQNGERIITITDKHINSTSELDVSGTYINDNDDVAYFIRVKSNHWSGFTYTKQGFLDKLTKLSDINVGKTMLKMNESLDGEEDDEKLPDTELETSDYVINVLNKSRIVYTRSGKLDFRITKKNVHLAIYKDVVGVMVHFSILGDSKGYTYTKEGFMRNLLNIYNVDVGNAMKQINK